MTLFIPSFPYPSPLFHFWVLVLFSRASTVFFCSKTKRKSFLRRLDSVACVSSFDEGASVDTSGFCTGFSSAFSVPCAICTSTSINDSYTKYLRFTAISRCSNKRMTIIGSSYPSLTVNYMEGNEKNLQLYTISRTQCSF